MWVKTTNGKLVNLDRFDTVEERDGALVATRFEKGQQLQYPEELAKGTPKELGDLLAKIGNANKVGYCDLSTKPKKVGGKQTVYLSDGSGNVR